MYNQQDMSAILQDPIKCAEAATNLAQTYFELHGSMRRGENVDLSHMHSLNNQLTAIVISQGQHIFLSAMIANIQKQQALIKDLQEQDLGKTIDRAEASETASNVVAITVKSVELNQLHPTPDAAQ
jgi:hypothetical protein